MNHPASIVISGAQGVYASRINGIFDASLDDLSSSMPLYKHRSDRTCRIIYDAPKAKWKVRCVDLDGKTIAKVAVRNGQTLSEIAKDLSFSSTSVSIKWVVKDGLRYEKYIPAPDIKLELEK
jgi:uncharacterized membrane protein